jgi:hypothetical protein
LDGRTGLRVFSGTSSLGSDSDSVSQSPLAPEDSLALVKSIITRLASDWDDDDPAYDPRIRFEEDSDSGDLDNDEISSVSHSCDESMVSNYLPADDLDDKNVEENDVGSPLDSGLSLVDSPVSDSTLPTSEDDGADDLEVPSAITLEPIRKHADRRLGIAIKHILSQGEDVLSRPLVDSPVSGFISPTMIDGGSDDSQVFSTVLESCHNYPNRRHGIYGDLAANHVLSLPGVSSSVPLSMDDALDSDRLSSRRQRILSMHSIRTQPKRVSGLQPLLLPRIISLRRSAANDAPPPSQTTWQRVSQFILPS